MIRKTALGLAAAATLAVAMATTASTASAGAKVHFSFGFPTYGHVYHAPGVYHSPYGYMAPHVGYANCPRVFVGYQKVRTHRGWNTRPIYRRHCGY